MAEKVISCLKNALKLAYMHLHFQNVFRGYILEPCVIMGKWWDGREVGGRRIKEKEREGKGGQEGGSCVPNNFSFRCAAPEFA
jgi:hypothetical protein